MARKVITLSIEGPEELIELVLPTVKNILQACHNVDEIDTAMTLADQPNMFRSGTED